MTRECTFSTAAVVALILFAPAVGSSAQTNFTTLYSFCSQANCADGSTPYAELRQASGGNLFGTTYTGGNNNAGTVFRINAEGHLTTLYSFCSQSACADGSGPYAGLLQGHSGNFYGTTESGGRSTYGTIFKITPSGSLSLVHSFDGNDGFSPYAGLVQVSDGNFYGTTGGTVSGANISGTVFKLAGGKLTTLYQFCSKINCTDGANPWGTLVHAKNGNFYGTTAAGGTHICKTRGREQIGCGTIFRMTPTGKLTTLYNFCSRGGSDCTDGVTPLAGMVEGNDGSFYGTTSGGGAKADGTVFKITSEGKLTTLHSFSGTDGANPYAGLIQAHDGYFYGTTTFGGAHNSGVLFKLAAAGKLTTLYNFCSQTNCADGSLPHAALIEATNGRLYGTTSAGGSGNGGTVFSLSGGLGTSPEAPPAPEGLSTDFRPQK